MQLHEIVFGVPLLLGALLVLGTALGVTALESDLDLEVDDLSEPDGLLSALGLGRVPLGIVAMLLTMIFGGVGWSTFSLISSHLSRSSALSVAWIVGALASLWGTRVGSRLLARILPSVETYASTKHDLIGEVGTVVVVLGPDEVVLRVRDQGGAELRVRGLTGSSVRRAGEQLVLTAYESTRDAYRVEALSHER